MRLNQELKNKSRLLTSIMVLPNLDPAIRKLIENAGESEEEAKIELEKQNESALKRALLEASDLSGFETPDSFFLTESDVSTLMDNTKILREKLHEQGKEITHYKK